jgi:hypothetical protein
MLFLVVDCIMGFSKRAKEEDDDEVEELHVPTKKQRIEKESSLLPQKKKKEKHSIFHDLKTQEGKEKWNILKMEGMTPERLTNWEKGWCDTHDIPKF